MAEIIAAREWTDLPNKRITRLDPIPLPHPIPPEVEGWLFSYEVKWLYETAIRLKAENVTGDLLEIGSYKGLSTSALAQAGRLTCVDTFKGGEDLPTIDTLSIFLDNLTKMGISPRVIVGRSQTVLPKLARKTSLKWRLILVDGSHLYENALADIRNGWRMLSEGGVLAVDDDNEPSVHRATQASKLSFQSACGGIKLVYAIKPKNVEPRLEEDNPSSNLT